QLHVLRHFKRETGARNLCLAGGVALNCSANGVIKRSELFDNIFVQPAAGDDGSALGAALYAQRLHFPDFRPGRLTMPLWGPEFTLEEIRAALAETAAEPSNDLEIIEKSSFEALCGEVAERLARGQNVAWFQ